MMLWETEIFALDMITGNLDRFRGTFIEANTLQEAIQKARKNGLTYLQFTGNFYRDAQHVMMEEEYYQKLVDPRNLTKDMDFDAFSDWLDLAETKEDLLAARQEFMKYPELSEHLKVIDARINLQYGNKSTGEENDQETDDSKEDDPTQTGS